MKLRRLFLIVTALLISGVVCFAARPAGSDTPPVRWRTIIKSAGPDCGTVTFKALVAPGWHLYGLTLPAGGPKPTVFDLKASTDVEFTGAVTPSRKPVESNDPLFGITLSWWDSNVEFTVPFKITGKAPRIDAKINYMACDGTTCMPPKTESISAPVKL